MQRIVQEHFAPLAVRVDDERQLVLIEGPITFAFPSGTDGTTVRVTLARNHPKSSPIAEDLAARFPCTADYHQNPSSKTECLWFQPESPWTEDEEALRYYLAQLVVHIERQLICEADPNHQWPGPARPHGAPAAYNELFQEYFSDPSVAAKVSERWTAGTRTRANEPCICGSGRKFKRCHRDPIEHFERTCGGIVTLQESWAQLAAMEAITT